MERGRVGGSQRCRTRLVAPPAPGAGSPRASRCRAAAARPAVRGEGWRGGERSRGQRYPCCPTLSDSIALIVNTQHKPRQARGCPSPAPRSRVALSVLSLVSLPYQMRAGWSFTILILPFSRIHSHFLLAESQAPIHKRRALSPYLLTLNHGCKYRVFFLLGS